MIELIHLIRFDWLQALRPLFDYFDVPILPMKSFTRFHSFFVCKLQHRRQQIVFAALPDCCRAPSPWWRLEPFILHGHWQIGGTHASNLYILQLRVEFSFGKVGGIKVPVGRRSCSSWKNCRSWPRFGIASESSCRMWGQGKIMLILCHDNSFAWCESCTQSITLMVTLAWRTISGVFTWFHTVSLFKQSVGSTE
jgi:hypothetical protein